MRLRSGRAREELVRLCLRRPPRHLAVAEDLPRVALEPDQVADAGLLRELLLGEIPAAVGEFELE